MNTGQTVSWFEPANPGRNIWLLRLFSWIVTALAGFLQTWASRFTITPDGNCYLDIATAYLQRDWHNAVNAYWSPVFSWLLALCLAILRPAPYWESTLLHLLNFVALLVSLLSFEFLFRAFLEMRKRFGCSEDESQGLPELGWWALGYALFISTSLFVLTASIATPDLWVAAFTYLAAGLILRIHSNTGGWLFFATLGLVLGCAYLTKTFYFPMSCIFLVTAWLASGNRLKTLKQAALGFLVFLLIAGPWVAALSRAKNRFTFGDVGKLALIIRFAPLQQPLMWQGENGTGVPVHPVRKLLAAPALFEFGTPITGSYPPVYDQTYWMEGARLHFTLKGLLLVIRQSAGGMFQFLMDQSEYATGLLVLFFLVRGQSRWAAPFLRQWFLWVPSLIACLSYTVVLVEGRYVAPFILLLWIAAYSCLLSLPLRVQRSTVSALLLAMLSFTGLRIAKFAVSDSLASLAHVQNTDLEIAQALRRLGIQPGDKVAGLSGVAEAHWARLAGVRIVAEIPQGNESLFWTAPPDLQRKVLEMVSAAGAKIIVTNDSPSSAIKAGWTPLGSTGYYALLVPLREKPRSIP